MKEQESIVKARIKQNITNIILVLEVIAEAIQTATVHSNLKGIPNGHLYAMMMHKVEYDLYTKLIGTLIKGGCISDTNHLLTWIGPIPEHIKRKGLTNEN